MSYYGGKRDGVDLSQFNQLGKELTPYGTFRNKVESESELIGFDRYSYGSKTTYPSREGSSVTGSLHSGGGNETLRDYGLRQEAATRRGQYRRDDSWVESIIPTIQGRSNIIPKIKQSQEKISERASKRQAESETLKPKIESAKQKITEAKAIQISVPRMTYASWGPPQGFYNNEYDYAEREKSIKIAEAEADLRELENLNKNYEEDIKQAQNLNKLLKEYEKEKKFEFLNDYESRSGGVMSIGGPDAPALTPTGSMRYRSPPTSSGFKAVTFDVPQKPFEAKPILSSGRERQYEDRIMREMKRQEIPFRNDFGLATRQEKRFNAKRFFG